MHADVLDPDLGAEIEQREQAYGPAAGMPAADGPEARVREPSGPALWPEPWGAITHHVDDLAAALADCRADAVLVSPEVGWTVVPATRSGRVFVDAQGTLNQRLAAICDDAVLVVAGRALGLSPAPDSLLS